MFKTSIALKLVNSSDKVPLNWLFLRIRAPICPKFFGNKSGILPVNALSFNRKSLIDVISAKLSGIDPAKLLLSRYSRSTLSDVIAGRLPVNELSESHRSLRFVSELIISAESVPDRAL